LFNIFGLSALVSATEQQHNRRTDLAKIDSIARTIIDTEFLDPIANPMAVSEIP
jgi:hypothetical protein